MDKPFQFLTDEEMDILILLLETRHRLVGLSPSEGGGEVNDEGLNVLIEQILNRAVLRWMPNPIGPTPAQKKFMTQYNPLDYNGLEPSMKEEQFQVWVATKNRNGTMAQFENSGNYDQWRKRLPEDARVDLPRCLQLTKTRNWLFEEMVETDKMMKGIYR